MAPILSSTEKTIEFMRGRNLLLQDYICCGHPCAKVTNIQVTDKKIFQCNNCRRRYSLWTGSFWFKSWLELHVLLGICYFFCVGSTVTEVLKFFNKKISKVSVIQWFTYFRDIMTTYIENNQVIFNQCTVHVDETFIGGKRKYHRGRIPSVRPRWLLGIVNKNEHKIHLQFIEKKDFINIIPVITRHIRPGCTINTDGAKVYQKVNQMNYIHQYCVHKDHFINPANGVHSNWIENIWSNLKLKLKSLWGSQNKMLDAHLDKYIYRYNRKNEGAIFNLLLEDIAQFYPI